MERTRDKTEAAQWAAKMLCHPGLRILDTETTGLDSQAQIVQIAIIDRDGTPVLDTYVNPTVPISEGAARVHGISYKTVAEAPSFAQILDQLYAAVGDGPIVIYNAPFDLRLLTQSAKAWGLASDFDAIWKDRWHCAMLPYSAWVGEWSSQWGEYRWQRLKGGDHSALGDCRATLNVLKRMAEAE